MELWTTIDELLTESYACLLNEESKGLAVLTAGYVTKTFSMRSSCIWCQEKLVFHDGDNEHNPGKYLQLLSCGGLTVPSLALANLIFLSVTINEETRNKNIR